MSFSFQVDSKDSSRNPMDSEFAAEAEVQNDIIEEPNKVQKRQRDRPRDQGSTVIDPSKLLSCISNVVRFVAG